MFTFLFCVCLITASAHVANADPERRWVSQHNKKLAKGILKSKHTTAGAGGLCDSTTEQKSGYFGVNTEGAHDANYFFWQFDSRSNPTTDPFIIWMTGGPGCSSQLALLTENGPCTVSEDGKTTINNQYSWTTNANVLWIDQPADVGYSYGNGPIDLINNEDEVADHMYNFIQAFMNEYPQYQKNDFFIFGESYGGHFVPAVSNEIYTRNKDLAQGDVHVNLKGIGIGNGLTDPVIQYQYYAQMANHNTYDIQCVDDSTYQSMVDAIPRCTKLGEACQLDSEACVPADDYCNLKETNPFYKTGLNPYDIRKECGDNPLCYDFDNVELFLNLNSTRQALGVSDKVEAWKTCNNAVNAMFASDWMHNFHKKLIPMLEDGIHALIYAGDCDFICNWMGNKAWTLALDWNGKDAFNNAEDTDWKLSDGTAAGKVREANGLTFLQVYGGGHMVPMDVPVAALQMLQTYIGGQQFV